MSEYVERFVTGRPKTLLGGGVAKEEIPSFEGGRRMGGPRSMAVYEFEIDERPQYVTAVGAFS